jgi:lambda repressor-like predicted transcriptional regulator
VSKEDVRIILQSHAEGSSLRGISRISGLAYDTVVSRSASSGSESANGT